jgi:hypothetical protein
MTEAISIQRKLEEPYGGFYKQIRSTQNVTGQSFTSSIKFTVAQDRADEYIVPKSSYMAVKLNIFQTDEYGANIRNFGDPIINTGTRMVPTAISIPYIVNDPVVSMFDALNVNLCGIENNNTFLQGSNTLYRILNESKAEQVINSTNAIKLMNVNDTKTTLGLYQPQQNQVLVRMQHEALALPAQANGLLSPHMLYALNNQYNFDNVQNGYLISQIPNPVFYSEDLIHLGLDKMILDFQVSTSWWQNIIGVAGSLHVNKGVDAVPVGNVFPASAIPVTIQIYNPGVALTANTIYIQVTDFLLYMYKVLWHEPRGVPMSIRMKKWCAVKYNSQIGSSINAPIVLVNNRHITHIVIAFQQPNLVGKPSTTDFTSNFADSNVAVETINTPTVHNMLQNFYCNFDTQYPKDQYNFGSNGLAGNSDTAELTRAYYDYLSAIDSFRDRAGGLMDFQTWLVNPIFVFKTQSFSKVINTLQITASLNTANNTNTTVFVLGLYDEEIEFHYDKETNIIDKKEKAL